MLHYDSTQTEAVRIFDLVLQMTRLGICICLRKNSLPLSRGSTYAVRRERQLPNERDSPDTYLASYLHCNGLPSRG